MYNWICSVYVHHSYICTIGSIVCMYITLTYVQFDLYFVCTSLLHMYNWICSLYVHLSYICTIGSIVCMFITLTSVHLNVGGRWFRMCQCFLCPCHLNVGGRWFRMCECFLCPCHLNMWAEDGFVCVSVSCVLVT